MSSTLPAVLSWLESSFAAAMPDGGTVYIGGPLQNLPQTYACVAYNEQAPGVKISVSEPDLDMTEGMEVLQIDCQVVSWTGDTSQSYANMAAAVGVVDAVEAGIRSDPTLGGVVMYATMTTNSVNLPQTSKGPVAVVNLTVATTAYRT